MNMEAGGLHLEGRIIAPDGRIVHGAGSVAIEETEVTRKTFEGTLYSPILEQIGLPEHRVCYCISSDLIIPTSSMEGIQSKGKVFRSIDS